MTKQDLINEVARLYDEVIAECRRQIAENTEIIARNDRLLRREPDAFDMASIRRTIGGGSISAAGGPFS